MSVTAQNLHRNTSAADLTAALSIRGLSKKFGGVLALNDVNLDVGRQEVHGLLGTNGSGKSTLIKILSGFHEPELGGTAHLYGKPLKLPVVSGQALEHGLAFVHQNLGLIPSLTVTENLRLNRIAAENTWRISWKDEHRKAREIFAKYELPLNPKARVGSLSAVQQALLAIIRAVEDLKDASGNADTQDAQGVLVLDEPTPFLPRAGVEQLFNLVRQVVNNGASVIFVSHDIDEVREICSRATVLRDGNLAGTMDVQSTQREEFVSRIIGSSLSNYQISRGASSSFQPFLEVDGLTAPGLGPVSFKAGKGEIVGCTGLIGSGAERIPSLLYGAALAQAGTLSLNGEHGRPLEQQTPIQSMQQGIAYLPADRLGAAGIGSLPVTDNVTLPVLEKLKNKLGLNRKRMVSLTKELGSQFDIRPNVPSLPLAGLSGGNQQKAVMAKWLQTAPDLLLLDEPTQGVDVGARQQLFAALGDAAKNGTTMLVASTDYEQLAQICHRVLIFGRGTVVAELTDNQISKDNIAEHCYRSMGGLN